MTFAVQAAAAAFAVASLVSTARAAEQCPATQDQLAAALKASVKASGGPSNGGLDTNMWGALVGRDGAVCAVAFSGGKWSDQWPGSRAIAAEKAYTTNAFSLDKSAFSTAQMYAGAQPGGFLFGLATSNPASTESLYAGDAGQWGTSSDPLIGKKMGGIITFGGGLALYTSAGVVGGLGVSGDTSCGDHNVAWRVRKALNLDKAPAGPAGLKNDGIIYDIRLTGGSASGFGHPKCGLSEDKVAKDIGAGGTSAPK